MQKDYPELGGDYLMKFKNQTELRAVKKEIAELQKKIEALLARKAALEGAMKKRLS